MVFFSDSFFLFAMIPCLVLRDLNFTTMGKLVFVRDFTRWAASISSGVILISHTAATLMKRSSMFSLALAGNPSISIISRLPYCSRSLMVDSLFRIFFSNAFTEIRDFQKSIKILSKVEIKRNQGPSISFMNIVIKKGFHHAIDQGKQHRTRA